MKEKKIEFEKSKDIGTILYVSIDGKYAGYILIADQIKEDSINAIKELKKIGIKQTIMLTGDRKEVGEDIASKVGTDKIYTELLPDGKVEKVENLLKQKSEKGKLVFVRRRNKRRTSFSNLRHRNSNGRAWIRCSNRSSRHSTYDRRTVKNSKSNKTI